MAVTMCGCVCAYAHILYVWQGEGERCAPFLARLDEGLELGRQARQFRLQFHQRLHALRLALFLVDHVRRATKRLAVTDREGERERKDERKREREREREKGAGAYGHMA
jgi:hypothetical protein